MDAFFNGLSTVFQALINAGAYVMLPIIITIIGLVFRMNIGKALRAVSRLPAVLSESTCWSTSLSRPLPQRRAPWLQTSVSTST